MRLVTLAFATADDFLAAYHPADGGTLSTRTRSTASIFGTPPTPSATSPTGETSGNSC